jgi:hypothetical protein
VRRLQKGKGHDGMSAPLGIQCRGQWREGMSLGGQGGGGVVGHGGERSGWRLKEVPACGSRLAADEREEKKVGRQKGEIGQHWRWASGLLRLRSKRKGRGERWSGLKEEAAVWAKKGGRV